MISFAFYHVSLLRIFDIIKTFQSVNESACLINAIKIYFNAILFEFSIVVYLHQIK